jgi:hypothetical protein
MSNKTVVTSIPNCDICEVRRNPPTLAWADCFIPSFGTWGNVCKQHFNTEGCQLGSGKGQEFELEQQEICTSPGICNCQEPVNQTERIKQNLKEAFAEAGEDGIPFDVLEELFEDRDPAEFL